MRISDWSSDVCSSDLPSASPRACVRPPSRDRRRRPGDPENGRSRKSISGEGGARRRTLERAIGKMAKGGKPRRPPNGQQINLVIPAKVGTQDGISRRKLWVPAFAGMTRLGNEDELRSEEHTSELQSLMRISYAVFCLKKKN